jgi:hypothetical protein
VALLDTALGKQAKRSTSRETSQPYFETDLSAALGARLLYGRNQVGTLIRMPALLEARFLSAKRGNDLEGAKV